MLEPKLTFIHIHTSSNHPNHAIIHTTSNHYARPSYSCDLIHPQAFSKIMASRLIIILLFLQPQIIMLALPIHVI